MAGVYVGVDVCVCIPELNKWSSLPLYTYIYSMVGRPSVQGGKETSKTTQKESQEHLGQ